MIPEPENDIVVSERAIKRMHDVEDLIRSLCTALRTHEGDLVQCAMRYMILVGREARKS